VSKPGISQQSIREIVRGQTAIEHTDKSLEVFHDGLSALAATFCPFLGDDQNSRHRIRRIIAEYYSKLANKYRKRRKRRKRRKEEERGGKRRKEEERGGKRRKEEERGGRRRKEEEREEKVRSQIKGDERVALRINNFESSVTRHTTCRQSNFEERDTLLSSKLSGLVFECVAMLLLDAMAVLVAPVANQRERTRRGDDP
jgi:type IV secretory pathway VirB10-like protein